VLGGLGLAVFVERGAELGVDEELAGSSGHRSPPDWDSLCP
jgi:hypothetical protein